MKLNRKSKMTGVGLIALMIASLLFVFYRTSGNEKESYRGPEFDLRKLTSAELTTLTASGLGGDCIAAYKVGRHHMFYTFDDAQAIHFFRLAVKCPNANAHASLISLLINKPAFDAEVDKSLRELVKLDPHMAEAAAVEISIRRKERVPPSH